MQSCFSHLQYLFLPFCPLSLVQQKWVALRRAVGAAERGRERDWRACDTKSAPNFQKKMKNMHYSLMILLFAIFFPSWVFPFLPEIYSVSFNSWRFLISIFINQLPTMSLTDNSLKGSLSPKGHFHFNKRCFADSKYFRIKSNEYFMVGFWHQGGGGR